MRAARGTGQPIQSNARCLCGRLALAAPQRPRACGKAAMISTGMARAYSGSAKPPPCQAPLRRACTNVPCPWPACPLPFALSRPSSLHQQSIDNPEMRGRRPPAPNQHRLTDSPTPRRPIKGSAPVENPSCAPALPADGRCEYGSSPQREAHSPVLYVL